MAAGGRGGQPPDKSQELLDSVNRLATATENLCETMPILIEGVEAVSQQFAVLIALEAQKRRVTPETLVQSTLQGLMERVLAPRNRDGG